MRVAICIGADPFDRVGSYGHVARRGLHAHPSHALVGAHLHHRCTAAAARHYQRGGQGRVQADKSHPDDQPTGKSAGQRTGKGAVHAGARADGSAASSRGQCADRDQRHASEVVHGVVAGSVGRQLVALRLDGGGCVGSTQCSKVGTEKCRDEKAAVKRERWQTGLGSGRWGCVWHGKSVPGSMSSTSCATPLAPPGASEPTDGASKVR